jgi:hypothetical protein
MGLSALLVGVQRENRAYLLFMAVTTACCLARIPLALKFLIPMFFMYITSFQRLKSRFTKVATLAGLLAFVVGGVQRTTGLRCANCGITGEESLCRTWGIPFAWKRGARQEREAETAEVYKAIFGHRCRHRWLRKGIAWNWFLGGHGDGASFEESHFRVRNHAIRGIFDHYQRCQDSDAAGVAYALVEAVFPADIGCKTLREAGRLVSGYSDNLAVLVTEEWMGQSPDPEREWEQAVATVIHLQLFAHALEGREGCDSLAPAISDLEAAHHSARPWQLVIERLDSSVRK